MVATHIRPATEADQETINQMVKAAQLDPTALHWSHFVMAEQDGQVIGIGQIRPYPRCRELGSLIVRKEFQEQGVGAQIVNALLEKETGVVYLECMAHNEQYYARFGFVQIPWYRAPRPLNFKVGVIGSIVRLIYRERVIAMKRDKSL
jgi:amino-acid N-acetyltransferase